MDDGPEGGGETLSKLGRGMGAGLIAKAREIEARLPAELDDPDGELPPNLVVKAVRAVAWHFFPLLAGDAADLG